MSRCSRFGSFNLNNVVLYDDAPQIILPEHSLYSNDITKPAQPIDVNKLYYIPVIVELIQLIDGSNAKMIVNLHWTEGVT